MAFRVMQAIKYVDEVMGVGLAITAYTGHKDEIRLAEGCLAELHSAIRDGYGEEGFAKIDEDLVKAGIMQILQGIKPLFD